MTTTTTVVVMVVVVKEDTGIYACFGRPLLENKNKLAPPPSLLLIMTDAIDTSMQARRLNPDLINSSSRSEKESHQCDRGRRRFMAALYSLIALSLSLSILLATVVIESVCLVHLKINTSWHQQASAQATARHKQR